MQRPEIENKILVIGVSGDPIASLTGSMATYKYIGVNNAAFLVHDGYGFSTLTHDNDCTKGAIKAYLTNGNDSVASERLTL